MKKVFKRAMIEEKEKIRRSNKEKKKQSIRQHLRDTELDRARIKEIKRKEIKKKRKWNCVRDGIVIHSPTPLPSLKRTTCQ